MEFTPMNPVIQKYINFYNNPFIQSIAFNERWTVSDSDKVPIDMYSFEYEGRIAGAKFQDERSLVTLPKSLELIPESANHAYFLNAIESNFVVLDIEPVCPDDIKQQLLKMPYIYGETSMSGKGYHLVFPLPDEILKYPNAQTKPALKSENSYYEILMNHYVTFTRNMIPPSTNEADFIPLFEELAAKQKETKRNDFFLDEIVDIEAIPEGPELLRLLMNVNMKKTIKDYDNDASRYEFAYGRKILGKIDNLIVLKKFNKYEYTDDMKAVLMYHTLLNKLPYREKHDEERQGLPWLLYASQEIIAKAYEKDGE